MKADLDVEHFCSIELISQMCPAFMWERATLGCDYEEVKTMGGIPGGGNNIPEDFLGEKSRRLGLCGLGRGRGMFHGYWQVLEPGGQKEVQQVRRLGGRDSWVIAYGDRVLYETC